MPNREREERKRTLLDALEKLRTDPAEQGRVDALAAVAFDDLGDEEKIRGLLQAAYEPLADDEVELYMEGFHRALERYRVDPAERARIAVLAAEVEAEIGPPGGGFYEDDEPVADVLDAFDRGEKGVTRPPDDRS